MQRELLKSTARTKITLRTLRTGKWIGKRYGTRMEFRLMPAPDLCGNRIHWRAYIRRVWISGHSGTVRDAIEAIEKEIQK